MSSARKRAAIQKAHTARALLQQKLVLAEHQVDVVRALAEGCARKADELVHLCRQLHEAEKTQNQKDWTAVISHLEKVGADSAAGMEQAARDEAANAQMPCHGWLTECPTCRNDFRKCTAMMPNGAANRLVPEKIF